MSESDSELGSEARPVGSAAKSVDLRVRPVGSGANPGGSVTGEDRIGDENIGTLVDAAGLAGSPDGFGRLWTPHRAAYVSGEAKPAEKGKCPFCVAPSLGDDEGLIVARGSACFALLNLYPYNSGHILVCTYRHVSLYTDLSAEERIEMGEMTAEAMEALRDSLHPAGFNLGMNQGDVAGAGIAAHIHQHIVPRWLGDANFLPIVAQTKAIPAILADTRSAVAEAWARVRPSEESDRESEQPDRELVAGGKRKRMNVSASSAPVGEDLSASVGEERNERAQ